MMDFVYTHEEAYLVHWYASWRKWPALYNSWRNVGSRECVPLPIMETQKSLLNCQHWMERESPRKTIFSILEWHMFDTEKNERKRAELVRSYFLDDPNQVVPILMERNKKYWAYERIFQWNTGIMDDDGNVCHQKQLRAKLGRFVYDYSTIHRSNDFLGIPMLEDVPKKMDKEECRENSD